MAFGQRLSRVIFTIHKPGKKGDYFIRFIRPLKKSRLVGIGICLCGNEYSRLTDQWEELTDRLIGEDILDIKEFRPLFAETWQYLITSTAELYGYGLNPADLAILSRLAVLAFYRNYPQSILPWEFEACQKIAEGLLQTLQSPARPGYRGNFYDGIIVVTEYIHVDHEVHISEFDSYLNELAKE